jgi:hypothetical protein
MRYLIPLAMFAGLSIGTIACNATANLKPQPPAPVSPQPSAPVSGQPFQPRMDQSCREPLPIVGGGIAEYIYYQNVDALIKSADLIVVGQPLTELGPDTTLRSMKVQKSYDSFNLPLNQSLVVTDPSGGTSANWTLTGFKVEQTLKGKLPATKLQILEHGIVISGKSELKHIRVIDSEAYTPLRKGKRYLLFLHKTLPTPTSFFDPVITYTTSLHQGKYNLDGGDCPEANLTKNNSQHRQLLSGVEAKYPKLFLP